MLKASTTMQPGDTMNKMYRIKVRKKLSLHRRLEIIMVLER